MAKKAEVKQDDERVTHSSGNVFADLALPDAEDLLHKSDLVIALRKVMEARGLSQTRVADLTGVDQPTVSKLLGGSLTSVTVDRLLTMLNRLGHNVTITVDDEPVSRAVDACVLVTFR